MLGSKCVMDIAGAPLRSSWGLFVFIITSYCACGRSVSQRWAAGGWTGHDSTSSGTPLGWWGVPGMLHGSRRGAGPLPCTNHCLHLPHSLRVSVTSRLSSLLFLQPPATNLWRMLKVTGDGEVFRFETEWSVLLSSSQSISLISWSRKRSGFQLIQEDLPSEVVYTYSYHIYRVSGISIPVSLPHKYLSELRHARTLQKISETIFMGDLAETCADDNQQLFPTGIWPIWF